MSEPKLMLIDGNSLLYRAFFALPKLHTAEGIYTNGVYGFITMLNRVMTETKPTHILVAFDKERKTFRNEIYSDYKANRSATPDELSGQFQLIRDILTAMNIKYLELPGFEADDIIGTISCHAQERGINTLIVTGDSDTLQLVSPQVTVVMTKKGITETEVYDPGTVLEKWEVIPSALIEVKGLMGDSSDNIPGVPGVGPKTAIKLIKEFNDLETLYERLEQVQNQKLRVKLQTYKEQAFLSRKLGTVVRNIEISWELDDYLIIPPDYAALSLIYSRLEFKSFIQALPVSFAADVEEKISLMGEVLELEQAAQADDFIKALVPGQPVAMYIKADYHHPMWAQIKDLYWAQNSVIYHLSLDHDSSHKLHWIKPMLESAAIPKYCHNAKFIEVMLLRHGISLQGVVGDTLLAAYVLDPAFEGHDLPSVLLKFLQCSTPGEDERQLVLQLAELYQGLERQMDEDLKRLLLDIELPLSSILAHMEFVGIKVDRNTLSDISQELNLRINQIEANIYRIAGQKFNLNSPKQLGQILFEELGLRVVKKTKTGYATGVEILEELYDDHVIIPYIMDFRQLIKLKSTYTDALQGLINPETGRIHTIFKQAQTATGRLSSVEPNLQNIPIKLEEGRRIRKAFISDGQDWLLLSADYSQIDLRVLAHISGDETLIETFHQGVDIHTRTASEIFAVGIDQVDEVLRRRAKAVNFGIIYGISDFGLARDTGVSRKEARRYIENYLDSYPGVKRYMEDIVDYGVRHGYVETILKRRRYLPDLMSSNKMMQAFARRMALNTPIQGTSADIIKLAMLKVEQELRQNQLRTRILLQVHDDLLLEVPRAELEQAAVILKNCMENAISLKVPLAASLKLGEDWYNMKPWF